MKNQYYPSAFRIFLTLAASIFVVELAIMIVFLLLPPLPPLPESMIDATSLTLLISPIIYRVAILPLIRQINKYRELTQQYEDLNQNLEQRVNERTAELQHRTMLQEKQSKELENANLRILARANHFEAISYITHSITAVRDLHELLSQITTVISERFGFYHVGLFLLDETREYALLTAANSAGGQRMLARQHRLKVGEQGIVGTATASGEPRIALDVGKDALYFDNPDLPETHSEIALPLKSGGKVIGALDVQSTEIGAFTTEDIQTLGLLADQVSLAIENARLFEESKKSLDELQAITHQYTREAWGKLPEQQKLIGYRYTSKGVSPLKETVRIPGTTRSGTETEQKESDQFIVPINLRGEIIGNLVVQSSVGDQWDSDQQDIIKAVAERVALSAENARLFEETNQRAERERIVSEITGKIRSHNDPQVMIETAVNELRKVLGASRVEIIPQTTPKAVIKDSEA